LARAGKFPFHQCSETIKGDRLNMDQTDAEDDDEDVYYVLPEDAIKFLPEEWQAAIKARAEDGRKVLETADNELKQLSRLSLSLYHLTVLKYIRDRLSAYHFEATMEAFHELDMLTTAFVATYARLHTGGSGSGFSRGALPEPLRSAHDEILDMRNKRYAHADEHHSVTDEMEIHEDDGRFMVTPSMRLGFYIGGSNDWPKLVDVLDDIFAERGEKIVERLKARTGREWVMAQGPAPRTAAE
jgi:hypothetical protein